MMNVRTIAMILPVICLCGRVDVDNVLAPHKTVGRSSFKRMTGVKKLSGLSRAPSPISMDLDEWGSEDSELGEIDDAWRDLANLQLHARQQQILGELAKLQLGGTADVRVATGRAWLAKRVLTDLSVQIDDIDSLMGTNKMNMIHFVQGLNGIVEDTANYKALNIGPEDYQSMSMVNEAWKYVKENEWGGQSDFGNAVTRSLGNLFAEAVDAGLDITRPAVKFKLYQYATAMSSHYMGISSTHSTQIGLSRYGEPLYGEIAGYKGRLPVNATSMENLPWKRHHHW